MIPPRSGAHPWTTPTPPPPLAPRLRRPSRAPPGRTRPRASALHRLPPGPVQRLLRDVGDGRTDLAEIAPEANGDHQPRRGQGAEAGGASRELPLGGAVVDQPAEPVAGLFRRRAVRRQDRPAVPRHP